MEMESESKLMFYFTAVYLLFFTALSIYKKNYEFLYYTIVMSALIFIIVMYHKKMHLSTAIIAGLAILGAMHIFGGNLTISGIRLYDTWIVSGLFRYDNLVHSYGTFIAAFIVYSLLKPHLDIKIQHNKILLSVLLILITMGTGAVNEVLELGAVVFLGAKEQVGDYINNALDLLFNLIGAILACFFIIKYNKKAK